MADQALDKRRLGDLLENARSGHAVGTAVGLGEDVERALRPADAADITQTSGNLESAIDLFRLWRRRIRNGELVVRIVPAPLLCLKLKEACLPAKKDRQRPTPTCAPAGPPKFEADLCKLCGAVFVAAEALGLHCAENTRVAQRLHCFGGHSFGLFGCKGPRLDLRTKLAHPAKDRGKFRPRRCRDVSGGGRGFPLPDTPPASRNGCSGLFPTGPPPQPP